MTNNWSEYLREHFTELLVIGAAIGVIIWGFNEYREVREKQHPFEACIAMLTDINTGDDRHLKEWIEREGKQIEITRMPGVIDCLKIIGGNP